MTQIWEDNDQYTCISHGHTSSCIWLFFMWACVGVWPLCYTTLFMQIDEDIDQEDKPPPLPHMHIRLKGPLQRLPPLPFLLLLLRPHMHQIHIHLKRPLQPSPPLPFPLSILPPHVSLTSCTRRILGLDTEFVTIFDGRLNKKGNLSGRHKVGHLAIATIDSDDDTSCTVLFNKVIQPTLREGEWVDYQTELSGITKEAYHNCIPYVHAIEEVRELLRDAIVVGHNVINDFRALDLSIYSPAHCVFDTWNNESLNALVPSEANKLHSKLLF